MLSEEAVNEFQKIYKKVIGKDISYEKALEQGTKLIQLVKAVYKPLPNNL